MRVRPVEANLDWTTLTDPTDRPQLSNTVLHSSSNSVTLTILPELIKSQVRNLVGKIPWRRERLPTPVFLPGEFHSKPIEYTAPRVNHNVKYGLWVMTMWQHNLISHNRYHPGSVCVKVRGPSTISIVLPFPECHIVRILQYTVFSDLLLS